MLPMCPLKAPPAVAEAIYNWTGFYLGLNAGGVRSRLDWTFPFADNSTAATSQRFTEFFGGAHVGLQYQFGSIVLGVEAALSTTRRRNARSPEASSPCAFPAPFDDRCDSRGTRALITAGPRIGWAPTNRLLVFGTGGYAQARLDTAIRFGGVGVPPAPDAQPVDGHDRTHRGWYVGGGGEFALTRHWSAGVEYQHVDLRGGIIVLPPPAVRRLSLTEMSKANIDVVRFRLTLRPDWPQTLSLPWGGR